MEKNMVVGFIAMGFGATGWLLPYDYNLLKPRRLTAAMLPEGARRAFPKVVGTALILVGIALMFVDPFAPKP